MAQIPVVFLPLTTTFSAPPACSSQFVIPGTGPNPIMYAYDPGQQIKDPTAPDCHPAQVVSWWGQDPSPTSTALGGTTFICPNLYSQVASITDSQKSRALIACCPSSYEYIAPMSAANPRQCKSTLKPGTLTFIGMGSDGLFSSSTSLLAMSSRIFGVQINGYITQGTASETSSGSSTTTGSSSTSSNSASTTTTTTPPPTASSEPSGLPTGAKAGIGGGIGGLVLLAILGAFLWYRRKNRYKAVELAGGEITFPVGGYYGPETKPSQELGGTQDVGAEFYAPNQSGPHELSSRPYGPTELA